jgi:hypothetical protein
MLAAYPVNMDANAASFVAALELASRPNYLGDTAVVVGLLRNLALTALKRRETLPAEDANKLNEADCWRLAGIFLGRDRHFTPMPWNSEGQVARFVAQQLDWPDSRPELVMRNMFAGFIGDFYRLADYVAEGATEDNWVFQVQGQVETYRDLLLGVPFEVV